jgi:hypothetical protein
LASRQKAEPMCRSKTPEAEASVAAKTRSTAEFAGITRMSEPSLVRNAG